MASSVNRVPLFDHIHYMYLTTIPSMLITLVIFTVLGLTHAETPDATMHFYSDVLSSRFHITPWLLPVSRKKRYSLPPEYAFKIIFPLLNSIGMLSTKFFFETVNFKL